MQMATFESFAKGLTRAYDRKRPILEGTSEGQKYNQGNSDHGLIYELE